jgi:hypothetical protein
MSQRAQEAALFTGQSTAGITGWRHARGLSPKALSTRPQPSADF